MEAEVGEVTIIETKSKKYKRKIILKFPNKSIINQEELSKKIADILLNNSVELSWLDFFYYNNCKQVKLFKL